jgi:hypothetical protein
MTLTLWNVNTINQVANIKPTVVGFLDYGCLVESGVWYQCTGTTTGSITLVVVPLAA